MFDVNPTLAAKGLTLSIDEHDHSLSLELARSVAPYFQLDIHETNEIINHLLAVRKSWRMLAKKCGIKPSEIDLFSSVFDTVR